jgi:DNA helicase-2/ATP-dependent DNA helicase PcrA
MTSQLEALPGLTEEQRCIVTWGDGPLVVIAGAGTGKTRVIVERVRWLLETRGGAAVAPDGALQCPYPTQDVSATDPFAGPLLPEQILVLTYNVKAARELGERIETAVGPATRTCWTVSVSFSCYATSGRTCHSSTTRVAAHPTIG